MNRLLCFDVETTGVDVHNDRIVQAFVGLMTPDGQWERSQEWLIDPGIEIPTGASEVHGYTTERIRAEGSKDVGRALEQIARIIVAETGNGVPLVIYNAPFDTTILNAELLRHGLTPIDYPVGAAQPIRVIDPFVLDKALDKYRKGKGMRKLTAIAPLYGVPLEANAHDAGADCLMTGRIAIRMLQNTDLKALPLGELHHRQTQWKREQSESYQAYLRGPKNPEGADPTAVVNGEWPIQTERSAA